MRTSPDNQELFQIIKDARSGKIVLPQFQRNFVWSRDDITSLLTSMLEGHFIGSFLLIRTDSESIPFAFRPIEGVDIPQDQLKPEMMILDGQQRITSLNYAFYAPDIPMRYSKWPYRFFLDLNKILEKDFENAIISFRKDQVSDRLKQVNQFNSLIIPFTEIPNWNDWLSDYEKWLIEKDKDYYFDTYFPTIKPTWNEIITLVSNFIVPTITIPKVKPNDPDSLAEVCSIFEKLNSTGVKLSVYDLLTARMYKYGIDLHGLWEQAISSNNQLITQYSQGESESFGVFVLRTLSLIRGLDVKSKTLINLDPKEFESDWNTAIKYIESALKRMTSTSDNGFGAFDPKWLPYMTMVSPLAAILYYIEKNKLRDQAYRLMQQWYWSSIFRERYAGAVESIIHKDYQDFIKRQKSPDSDFEVIREAKESILDNRKFTLLTISRLNSIYRGVMCLVAMHGAKDFAADDSIEFHTLEDHHIFPQGYLAKQKTLDGKKYSPDIVNCIVNRTLISASTNNKIRHHSPSDYLSEIVPADRVESILKSHYINKAGKEAMILDAFEQFLAARDKELVKEIRRRIAG